LVFARKAARLFPAQYLSEAADLNRLKARAFRMKKLFFLICPSADIPKIKPFDKLKNTCLKFSRPFEGAPRSGP
jgi:hypothetical protein